MNRHTAASGPTPAEARVLEVFDVFERLLDRKPALARQMAYELEAVAHKYAPPKPPKEQTDE